MQDLPNNRALPELKRWARNLRLKGVRAKEISEILGTGHSPWVVRKWLRESPVPSTEERVIESYPEMNVRQIADSLGVTERRVHQIIQQTVGPRRKRWTPAQNVELFLSEPSRHMKKRFTQSVPFGLALLKKCVSDASRSPAKSLQTSVGPMNELFLRNWNNRRSEPRKREALCLYIQGQGVEAHVFTAIDSKHAALLKLNTAMSKTAGCLACEADQFRRLGLLYASLKRWREAWTALRASVARYRHLGGPGHDLHCNGMANCALLSCILSYHTLGPEIGANEARKGMKMITEISSSRLFGNLVFALAKCLISSKDYTATKEAKILVDWCFSNMEMAHERSVPRAMLFWLRGFLEAVEGRKEEAYDDLVLALEDAFELKLEEEVGAIVADIGSLKPLPREIRNIIEDFCDWDDAGNLLVPPWCERIGPQIQSLYNVASCSAARIDTGIFSKLRKAANGKALMPAFSFTTNIEFAVHG